MSHYAITLVDHPEVCPVVELVNLRRQAASISKSERLFETRTPWPNAQRARHPFPPSDEGDGHGSGGSLLAGGGSSRRP